MSNTLSGQGALNHGSDNIAVGRDLFINYTSALSHHEGDQKRAEQLRSEKQQALLRSLRFAGMDDRQWQVKRAHASTCEWFLETSEYLGWLENGIENSHNGFLWIKGKPGAGKSTLMKLLLGRTREAGHSGEIISFFFNARAADELKRSTLGLYRSLSVQLLEAQPQLQAALDGFPAGHVWCIESLKELFELALQALGKTPVLCFIDALDECQEQEVRDMVTHLSELCYTQTRLRVCLSSRHYPHITMPKGGRSMILEETDEHSQDILHYINHTLHIGDGPISNALRVELLEKASGVFMWVVLVVQILNKAYDAGDKHHLQQRLRQLPGDLHKLFREIVTRDGRGQRELLLCLQWVLSARRPLTPRELYLAIISGADPESLSQCHSNEITDDDIERFLIDKSKGLTELTRTEAPSIQFIHESVRDYLLKDNGFTEIWPDPLTSSPEARNHEALRQACLNYIESEPVARLRNSHALRIYASSEELENTLNKLRTPFLEYALSYVLIHANEAETLGCSQKDFLTTFPYEKWVKLSHIFDRSLLKHKRYQLRTLPSLLYTLSSYNLGALIKIYPAAHSCFEVEGARYGTPLFAALAAGFTDAAKALIERQLRLRTVHVPFNAPLVCFHEYESVSSYFRRLYFDSAKRVIHTRFFSEKGVVNHLIDAGNDNLLMIYCATERPNFRLLEEAGFSPLANVAYKGNTRMAQLLLTRGANVNATDRRGWTPLHIALDVGHLDVAKILVDNGADLNAPSHGWSPLDVALYRQHYDMVVLLTRRGASCYMRS